MSRFLLVCCLIVSVRALGATVCVPSKMRLADIKLVITEEARRQIQKKVDSLTRSEKDFKKLLYRIGLYFPHVEKIFKEEGIPPDFKYQAIQESALISDVVRVGGDDCGFWQFKRPAALESGLVITGAVDERMHIVASTKAAARYLKSHYRCFDNWLYALLAYNVGRGGLQGMYDYKKYRGVKKMRIDANTHWYIIHFLAHKLVFANSKERLSTPEIQLVECWEAGGKTLSEIAQDWGTAERQLKEYNKWLKGNRVPPNTTCSVIVPTTRRQWRMKRCPIRAAGSAAKVEIDYALCWEQAVAFPAKGSRKKRKSGLEVHTFNGIEGMLAQPSDSLSSLAQAGNLSLDRFLSLNDIENVYSHSVVPGQVYYFQPKSSGVGVRFHIVRPGETWWSIAQKYGIKKKALLLKNRLRQESALEPGRVLWLRSIRPARVPIAYGSLRKNP